MGTNVAQVLGHRPSLTDLGVIPNPEEFSSVCQVVMAHTSAMTPEMRVLLAIRDEEAFSLNDLPPQFRPTAAMAKAAYDQKFNDDNVNCTAYLRQGIIAEDSNFTPLDIHIDVGINRTPINDDLVKLSFVVSDCLPTIFYDQEFKVPDYPVREANSVMQKIFQQQARDDARVSLNPYHLMQSSPYAVHAPQAAPKPMFRTFMLMRFH